ncbi:MAG: HAMP domain-containing histidine kinase [Oscillospiraceae bacterium]|nr:HAMP domain-containing histidine kinase [Oscillospiraceae bacterium]
MLNSIYSRIFYLCTVVLLFACSLTGLVTMSYANRMHQKEAKDRCDTTAKNLMLEVQTYMQEDAAPNAALRKRLEEFTRSENVDCYIFDSNGRCVTRSDSNITEITLSPALRRKADKEPYYELGGASGNYMEATATWVERIEQAGGTDPEETTGYYMMMIFPMGYLSEFSSKLITLLAVSLIVIGIACAMLFYLNTTRVLSPVLQVTKAAELYAKGDFSQRLQQTGDPEMDRLTTTMNHMADFIDRNERSRRRFVSDVSHELKTPITSIGGFVNGILDGTIPQAEEKKYLRIVSSEVDRMSRLVHTMLNISRFEEGTMAPRFERADITHLLIKTILLFENKVNAKSLFVEGLDECPRAIAVVDKDLVQQVFYNLTENAIKFVNKEGTLSFAVDSDDEHVNVHIRNTGEGLTEEEISRVFDRFYKTDESRGKDTTGVGLGLSIVSRIVALHGGQVTVKSVKGEYTEFIVTLPRYQRIGDEKPKDPKGGNQA